MKPGMPGGGIRAHADRVAKISTGPAGRGGLGYTQQQPTEDRYLLTRTELLDRLDVLLGGVPARLSSAMSPRGPRTTSSVLRTWSVT